MALHRHQQTVTISKPSLLRLLCPTPHGLTYSGAFRPYRTSVPIALLFGELGSTQDLQTVRVPAFCYRNLYTPASFLRLRYIFRECVVYCVVQLCANSVAPATTDCFQNSLTFR